MVLKFLANHSKRKTDIMYLEEGNKVKVSLRMKGRQQEHPEISVAVLENFFEKVKDVASMEKKPTTENRSVFMMLSPIKK